VLVAVDHEGKVEMESLAMFTQFLEKTLARVPEMKADPDLSGCTEIEKFIAEHELEISGAARKFMDQPSEEAILVFSFAHNFRFIANCQAKRD
jgi:hypothetical protein